MKKLFLILIISVIAISLLACGGNGGGNQTSNKESLSTSENHVESAPASESESYSESISQSNSESDFTSESEITSDSESVFESESQSNSESQEQTTFLVTFDSNGGSAVDGITVKKGEKITKPADPIKSNKNGEYEFLGWYYAGAEWDFEKDVVTENVTLIAKWKLVEGYTKPYLPK